jgi:hypothetical protein
MDFIAYVTLNVGEKKLEILERDLKDHIGPENKLVPFSRLQKLIHFTSGTSKNEIRENNEKNFKEDCS